MNMQVPCTYRGASSQSGHNHVVARLYVEQGCELRTGNAKAKSKGPCLTGRRGTKVVPTTCA